MAAKYEPLTAKLAEFASAGRTSAEFDFADIAALVGGLPPTAHAVRQWWANSATVQAQAWRAADWHVDHVDFARQRVRYARGPVGGSYLDRASSLTPKKREQAVVALVEETDSAHLDVRVHLTWQRAGQVVLDRAGDLAFPALPLASGIYRITLTDAPGQGRPKVYVGESGNLKKRAYNYRRPTPRQQTSQRIHNLLQEHLTSGGRVVLAVATNAAVEVFGDPTPLTMGRKTARVLAEHAALALIYANGGADVINLDKGS